MKLTLFRRQFLRIDDEILPIEVNVNWINRWVQAGLKSQACISFTPEEIKTSALFSACIESKNKYINKICIFEYTLLYNGHPLVGYEIMEKKYSNWCRGNGYLTFLFKDSKLEYITLYLEVNDEACC